MCAKWYDPEKNFTPEKAIKDLKASLEKQFDPQDILDIVVEVVESDKHTFRSTWPAKLKKDVIKTQQEAWEAVI